MSSFYEFYNLKEQDISNDENAKAMEIIRKGLAFAKPGCKDFWESFKELCNDRDGLAQLLGANETDISSWPSRIEQMLEKVRMADSSDAGDKKAELVPTEPIVSGERDVRGTTEEPRLH